MEKKSCQKRKRSHKKKSPNWCLYIKLDRNDIFCKRIYFRAFDGGVAKDKALSKLQGFLCQLALRRNTPVDVLLKRSFDGGRIRDKKAPKYVLRQRSMFSSKILATQRSSAIFTIVKKEEK